ncbi:hypothetical protein TSUD_329870 [Trifolium subterraneum]|nr:hypothetical protein TSUD_329870 [Trifolium subterraneum]
MRAYITAQAVRVSGILSQLLVPNDCQSYGLHIKFPSKWYSILPPCYRDAASISGTHEQGSGLCKVTN